MELLVEYEKLFKPYTVEGHSLDNTLKYLGALAKSSNIPESCMELALNEVFSELAEGVEFSKTKCHCGCGIDKAATDLIHSIRDRMIEINKDRNAAMLEVYKERYTLLMESAMRRVSTVNKEYEKMMRPPLAERSKIVGALQKTWWVFCPEDKPND